MAKGLTALFDELIVSYTRSLSDERLDGGEETIVPSSVQTGVGGRSR
jgi:hypothetical protein